jgi:sRNA-binding carbon storage regulator CsrA
MGYLVLTRKENQQIRLTINPGVDTSQLLHHLLRDGITISVSELHGKQVRIGIEDPNEMLVLREELRLRPINAKLLRLAIR